MKPDDVKTVETYKKAIKMDGARISPSSKIKFWIYRDVELHTAAGQKQKLPVFLALIDDRAVKPLLKKNPVCKGLCGLEGGKIAFEPEQGKLPYKQLKVSVPLLLGKMVHIPANTPEEDEDSETEDDRPAPSATPAATPAAGPAASPVPPPPPNAAQWNALLQQLEQKAQQAVAANPAQRATLAPMVAGIREKLALGDFAEARKRIDALNAALKAAAAPPASGATGPAKAQTQPPPRVPASDLVKYRQALLQFAQAKSEVKQQVAALKNAILKVGPQTAAFADQLTAKLEKLNEAVDDAVTEAMKASKNEASPANDQIKQKIRKYLAALASDPLIRKVEANPLGVKVTIGKTLGGALARINAAMPA